MYIGGDRFRQKPEIKVALCREIDIKQLKPIIANKNLAYAVA